MNDANTLLPPTDAFRRTAISVDEPEPVSGATSFTTSYESTSINGDAVIAPALTPIAQHRPPPSSPFLEPPKLTVEAKRQKYK